MFGKHTALIFIGVTSLLAFGCGREAPDKHLIEIALKLKEQQRQLDRIDKAIQSIQERFGEIEESVLAPSSTGEAGPLAGDDKKQAGGGVSSKEYEDIMGQIAVVQGQLVTLEQEILMFQQGEEQVRRRRERDALRDQGAAWQATGQPEELSRRLDILLENFSGNITDPQTKEQFVADVEEMKKRYLTPLSPEERQEQARAAIVNAMDLMPDERSKVWLEEQLQALDQASNPLEVGMRVNVTLQLQKMREMGELAEKYSIPGQTMRDSGLLFFPAGGSFPTR